jgi:hypothetical protein
MHGAQCGKVANGMLHAGAATSVCMPRHGAPRHAPAPRRRLRRALLFPLHHAEVADD